MPADDKSHDCRIPFVRRTCDRTASPPAATSTTRPCPTVSPQDDGTTADNRKNSLSSQDHGKKVSGDGVSKPFRDRFSRPRNATAAICWPWTPALLAYRKHKALSKNRNGRSKAIQGNLGVSEFLKSDYGNINERPNLGIIILHAPTRTGGLNLLAPCEVEYDEDVLASSLAYSTAPWAMRQQSLQQPELFPMRASLSGKNGDQK